MPLTQTQIEELLLERLAEMTDWQNAYNALTPMSKEIVDRKVEEATERIVQIATRVLPGVLQMSVETLYELSDYEHPTADGVSLYTLVAVLLAEDLLLRAETEAKRSIDPEEYQTKKGKRRATGNGQARKEASDGTG